MKRQINFYKLYALATLLALSSCNNDDNPIDNASIHRTETNSNTTISLDLSGEALMKFDRGDNPRDLSFNIEDDNQGAHIAPLTAPKLYSIAVISDADGLESYTFYLEWTKSDVDNRYYVKEIDKNDIDGNEVAKLDLSKQWYISGVVTTNKHQLDLNNRKIKFAPNADVSPVNNSNTQPDQRSLGKNEIDQDIPLYFDWTKLSIPTEKDGTDAVSTAKTGRTLGTPDIKIRPMGVMMRIKVRNDNKYTVRVKSLRIFSSVLSTKGGALDLNGYKRPTKVDDINYIPDTNTENESYDLPDFTLEPGQQYGHDFLIWAMPIKPQKVGSNIYFSGRPFSQVLLEAKRLVNGQEQDKPKMNALYVWGSESNSPKQSTRLRITAKLIRPMSVLEYFSDGYWNGTTGESPFTLSSYSYQLSSQELLNLSQVEFPQGYRALEYNDGRLLVPTWITADNLVTRKENSRVLPGTDLSIRFPGDYTSTPYVDTAQLRDNVLYALRFDDGKGNRKQLSAWRYDMNTGAIETIYLGPSFKGVFSDIVKPNFWDIHGGDKERVTYGSAKNTYFYKDGRPVEWYYQRYGDDNYTINSSLLLSTLAERYYGRVSEKLAQVSVAMDYIYKSTWALGLFRYSYKQGNNWDYVILEPSRNYNDPQMPPNVHENGYANGRIIYGPSIEAIQRGPIILAKKRADY